LIGGLAEINVDDWEKNTIYKSYDTKDKVVRWFWVCVRGMTQEQQVRLLQFVTGTSRVPLTGFKDLWGPFSFLLAACLLDFLHPCFSKTQQKYVNTLGSDGPRPFCIEQWGDPKSFPRSHTWFSILSLYYLFLSLSLFLFLFLFLCSSFSFSTND